MAFLQFNAFPGSLINVGFEEGTLKRRNVRGGAGRSAGGVLMMDRQYPWDTYTVDSVLLDTAEFESVLNAVGSDTTGYKVCTLDGDFAPLSLGQRIVLVRVVGWKFEDSRYRRISFEMIQAQ